MKENVRADVVVVGGGLSGLVATWQLCRGGVNAVVLEARPRLGGRILTVGINDGAACDLGPSWFWQGQPLVASLLEYFDIPSYEQFSEGLLLFQQANGQVERTRGLSPMAGSWRIVGGIQRLIDALKRDIDPSRLFLEHVVSRLSIDGDSVLLDIAKPSGQLQAQAKQVALAIPPRLAANLSFSPELPEGVTHTLAAVPTWMAGHAKLFAVYEEPFWRKEGLCGTAISRRGPLAEIHDASPSSGRVSCLSGFVGLGAESRTVIGQPELKKQAIQQLATLFGEKASRPTAVYLQDWSQEPFTANLADHQAPTRHPQYGLDLPLGDAWDRKIEFISTETAFENGGLIEGALEAGLRFSRHISGSSLPISDGSISPRTAGMSWDWL